MAVNTSRSMNADLAAGTVDGKYIHERPDTTLDAMNAQGNRLMRENRQSLNPLNGFSSVEYPRQINPAGE